MAVSTRSTGETMRAPGPSSAAPSAAPVAGGAAGVVSASLPVVAVDASLPTPPYRQIVDAVLAGVASGSLARGDRLPPVRALAAELGVAPGTVARAYKELEAHGTIRTRGRAGTFVAASADARADAAHQAVRRCLDTLLERLGYTPDEAVELVRRDAAARA